MRYLLLRNDKKHTQSHKLYVLMNILGIQNSVNKNETSIFEYATNKRVLLNRN